MTDKTKRPPYTNRGVTPFGFAEKTGSRSAVDWVTATTEKDHVAMDWYDILLKYSSKREGWSNKWYQGVKCDGLRWGYSQKQGYILIASGEVANRVFFDVVPAAKNITRLDLSVDVVVEDKVEDLAKNYFNKLSGRKDRKYALILNSLGGETLYVGSRSSDQFGRLYDKGVETGELAKGSWWRYEVELKGDRSRVASGEFVSRYTGDSDEHAARIGSFVHGWFLDRGVFPIFDAGQLNDVVVTLSKKITSEQRQIEWLRTQVAPTIERLTKAGYKERVLEALGIGIWEEEEK